MASLQITVQHRRVGGQEHSWPVSAVFDSNDGLPYRKEGTLILPSDWQYELRRLSWDANKYGKFLGEALFKGNFRLIIYQALNEPNFIKVFLNVEASELTPLRWERLFFPDSSDSWHSLAQHQQLVFSIYLPSLVSRQYPALNKHTLEALVLVASPSQTWKGCKPFDVGQSVANIRTSFEHFNRQPTFLSKPEQVTWEGLKQALKAKHYPILHIVAHGSYDKDKGESYLLLLDEEGQPQKLSATTFINQLKSFIRLPNLIFLCSCNTATPETTQTLDAHEHFARRLLDDLGTPAVIAMTDEVTIMTAELLSKQFYNDLYALAHVDQALAKAGLSLASRLDRYVPVLYQRLGYRPLFTNEPTALNKLNAQEIRHGLTRLIGENGLSGYLYERAPILSSECLGLIEQLDPDNPSEQVLEDLDALCQSITELGFSALAQNEKPSDYVKDCPFPGLRPFRNSNKDEDSGQNDTKDSTDYREFFFGREAKVTELCDRLDKINILMIKGDSGSGKSSLVYAGLLPELKRRCQANHKPWQSIVLRPYFAPNGQSPLVELQRLIEKLDKTQPAVIFVDQFEELFTTCPAKTAYEKRQLHQQFLDVLLELPQQYSEWKLILTMRVDFSGDCALYADLKKVVQDQSELLAPMSIEELRPAIEAQVAKAKLILEQGLLHALLEKVDGEPGAMPLVQYSLWLLWLRRRGRYLLIEEYKKTEAVGNAIGSMAESHFQSYAKQPSDQAYIRNIYLRLVRPDNERHTLSADKYRDTRQRVPKVEFYPKGNNQEHDTGNNKVIIDRLLQELANEERRLIVMYEDSVEIAHEALIQHWSLLNKWLNDGGINLLQQGITEATRAWKIEKHKDKQRSLLIHTGTRLQDIDDYRKKQFLLINEQEAEYLNACHLEDRRRTRNQRNVRVFAVIMFVLFLVAGLVSWLAIEQKNTADDRLAEQYFQQGIEVRDNEHQRWDKAQHYFAKALDVVVDEHQRESLQYASSDLESFRADLKTSMHHGSSVLGVQLFAQDTRIVTWGTNGIARIWDARTGRFTGIEIKHNGDVLGAQVFAQDTRILSWNESKSPNNTIQLSDTRSGASTDSPIQRTTSVNGAQVFAQDTHIVTWNNNGRVQLWNASTGEQIGLTMQHNSSVKGVQVFAQGTRILTWSDDRTARIWNANTQEQIALVKHDDAVIGAQVFGQGTRILTWSEDRTAKVWNVNTQEQIGSSMQHDGMAITGAQVFAQDTRVVTWGMDGAARIWSATTEKTDSLIMQHGGWVTGVKVFAQDTRIATWSTDGAVKIWKADTGESANLINSPIQHSSSVIGVQVFAQNKRLLTWSSDSTARIWDVDTGEQIGFPMQHGGAVTGAQIFAKDTLVVTWCTDGVVRIWDISTIISRTETIKHINAFDGSKLFAQGEKALTWIRDSGVAEVRAVSTGQRLGVQLNHGSEITDAQVLADETRIVTLTINGIVRLWDVSSGQLVRELVQDNVPVYLVKAFEQNDSIVLHGLNHEFELWNSPNVRGARIVTRGSDGVMRLWSAHTGKLLDLLQYRRLVGEDLVVANNDWAKGARLFAQDRRIVVWSAGKLVWIWDTIKKEKIGRPMEHDSSVTGAQVFAQDTRVLTWSTDRTARIWSTNTQKNIGSVMWHSGSVRGAKVFAQDTRIVTWSEDGVVRVWDASTGQQIGLSMRHGSSVIGVQIFAKDTRIVTLGEDGVVQLWDAISGLKLAIPMKLGDPNVQVFVQKERIVAWSKDSAKIWKFSKIAHQKSFLSEVQQVLKGDYYINNAGDLLFLTKSQIEKCQTLYQPYQECNKSDSNLCKVKRQWWSVQKFFGQLPTLEDCLN